MRDSTLGCGCAFVFGVILPDDSPLAAKDILLMHITIKIIRTNFFIPFTFFVSTFLWAFHFINAIAPFIIPVFHNDFKIAQNAKYYVNYDQVSVKPNRVLKMHLSIVMRFWINLQQHIWIFDFEKTFNLPKKYLLDRSQPETSVSIPPDLPQCNLQMNN